MARQQDHARGRPGARGVEVLDALDARMRWHPAQRSPPRAQELVGADAEGAEETPAQRGARRGIELGKAQGEVARHHAAPRAGQQAREAAGAAEQRARERHRQLRQQPAQADADPAGPGSQAARRRSGGLRVASARNRASTRIGAADLGEFRRLPRRYRWQCAVHAAGRCKVAGPDCRRPVGLHKPCQGSRVHRPAHLPSTRGHRPLPLHHRDVPASPR